MKKTKFRSLTVTLVIVFLAVNAEVLLIANCLQVYFNFQIQQSLIISQQQLIAQKATNTVRSFVQARFDILKTTARMSNLLTSSGQEQKLVLEKLLGSEPAFRQLVLFDAQEREMLNDSRLSSLLSVRLTEQTKIDMFSQTKLGKEYISSVYIDEITSEPMVVMAVPIMNVFADFKGVLLAEVNLKFMWDLVGSIKIGNTGQAYVVDRNGNLIAFGDISRVLKGENLVHIKEVAEFVNGPRLRTARKTNISKGIQNTYVVSSRVPLGVPEWSVVVELSAWEAYKPILVSLKVSIWTTLLSFTLAILAVVYLATRITKPVIDLRDAAIKIGQGRMDTRIRVKSRDEDGRGFKQDNSFS
jgi:nitrogen fixation/metabolism regulation signal transduction histidine kinase